MGGGAYLCFEGDLTLGSLVSFQTLFVTMSVSLLYVVQYVPNLVHGAGGLARVEQLLNEKPRVADAANAEELPRFSGDIRFQNVIFGYTDAALNLNGVSFTIRRGESVAFVGASGSGKSTVLNLLTRFHDPKRGAVTIDGHDLRSVAQDSWRAQIGVVFQESFLFNTSLRENIRMGRPGASDTDVVEAAEAAEIHDLIQRMPEKYDTRAGERGGRLSGGQRQRIAIARALLRDPPVLMLDEATSALDAAAEAAINATLDQAGKGRTVIAVTHRLASVVNADRVFVLDHGRLVEQGSHRELVEQGGVYQRLWEKQGGFTISPDAAHAHVHAQRLKAIPLLESLDEAALARLSKLFATERFAAGRKVFAEGHPGDKFYVIVRGSVVATTTTADGQELQLGVIQDGDYFGEIALLEDTQRTATIRTRSECLFLTLQREHFLRLLGEMPRVRAAFERVARERLKQRREVAEAEESSEPETT
jgi:ATP-binding cassette subfamily B protein